MIAIRCASVALLFLAVGIMHAQNLPTPRPAALPSTAQDAASMTDLARLFLGRAADRPPKACVNAIHAAMADKVPASRKLKFSKLLDPNSSPLCGSYLILSSSQFAMADTASRGELLKDVEQQFASKAIGSLKAVAQQEGSSTGTGGSTSLTAKGLSSKLLSIASEYGALTQSTSSNTTTVQGTLAGIPVVLMQKGALEECATKIFALAPCLHQGALAALSRISYSVAYDTSSASGTIAGTPVSGTVTSTVAQPVNVSSNAHSISAITTKGIIIPGKLNSTAYATADKQVATGTAIQKVLDAQTVFQGLENLGATPPSAYQSFVDIQSGNLSADADHFTEAQVTHEWKKLADGLVASLGLSATMPKESDKLAASKSDVLIQAVNIAFGYLQHLANEESADFAAVLAAPPVLTAEYDYNRPAAAPSNSVFRAIFQKTYRPITITINGAASIYNEDQPNVPGAGRLRDSQFAAEVSHPFSVTLPSSGATNFTVSGAFYDQYQSSPSILNVTPGAPVDGVTFTGLPSTATQVYGTKGNIAIGQVKLTAGGGSAVTVPVSLTYSNRTELITSPTWKAQIGLSYDFDSLFSARK
jgi:hypothetical protein